MYKIEAIERNRETILMTKSSSKKGNADTARNGQKDKSTKGDVAATEEGKEASDPNKFKRLDMPIFSGENPDVWLVKVERLF